MKLMLQGDPAPEITYELTFVETPNGIEVHANKPDGTPASALNVLGTWTADGGALQFKRGITDVPGIVVDPAAPQHVASPAL